MGLGAISPFPLPHTNDVICWFSFDHVLQDATLLGNKPFVVNEIGDTNIAMTVSLGATSSGARGAAPFGYMLADPFKRVLNQTDDPPLFPSSTTNHAFAAHMVYQYEHSYPFGNTNLILSLAMMIHPDKLGTTNLYYYIQVCERLEEQTSPETKFVIYLFFGTSYPTNDLGYLKKEIICYQTNSFVVPSNKTKYLTVGQESFETYWISVNGVRQYYSNSLSVDISNEFKTYCYIPRIKFRYDSSGSFGGVKLMDNFMLFDRSITDEELQQLCRPLDWKMRIEKRYPPLPPPGNQIPPSYYRPDIAVILETGEGWRKFKIEYRYVQPIETRPLIWDEVLQNLPFTTNGVEYVNNYYRVKNATALFRARLDEN